MTVEKCLINIEDKELMVYFHDGKKIEEEIEAFEVTAAMFGYRLEKHTFASMSHVYYQFVKESPQYQRVVVYMEWVSSDMLGNATLSEISVENQIGFYGQPKAKSVYLNVESSYKDIEKIFTEFKSYLQM